MGDPIPIDCQKGTTEKIVHFSDNKAIFGLLTADLVSQFRDGHIVKCKISFNGTSIVVPQRKLSPVPVE